MTDFARARFDTGGPWWVYLIPAAMALALLGYIAWCIWTDPLRKKEGRDDNGKDHDHD